MEGVHYDYSRIALAPLNESALYENKGLGTLALPDGYGAGWFCPGASYPTYKMFDINGYDWNCNGVIQTTHILADLNHSGTYSSLTSANNWTSITFRGNGVIGSGAPAAVLAAQSLPITIWVEELTPDQGPPAPCAPK